MLTPKDYQSAIQIQDGCNLSGIVFEWARIMQKICDESHKTNQSTDWKNNHPINILFADKIADLTGIYTEALAIEKFSKAYDECVEKSKEVTSVTP